MLGLCVTRESASRLAGRGIDAAALDISQPVSGVPCGWESPDVLIHCASSGRGGADAYRAVYRDGLRHVIEGFAPRRVVFTGSTSVYGQVDGSLVTEESVAEPDRETGRVLLEAEGVALAHGGVVARLAGIYGPGRSVLLRKFREGTAVLEDGGHRWINQIHRDDAAAALFQLSVLEDAAGVYNVCDDVPATQREVYGWIAARLGGGLPPVGPADTGRKRGWTSKRVSNARLRATGWRPTFPSYREALSSLIEAGAGGSENF